MNWLKKKQKTPKQETYQEARERVLAELKTDERENRRICDNCGRPKGEHFRIAFRGGGTIEYNDFTYHNEHSFNGPYSFCPTILFEDGEHNQ